MNDIFLSYASEDRQKAKQIANALMSQGWSVWWDRTITAGRAFDDAIEEAIDQSKCMIVLWSGNSVSSRWVKTEANEGVDRHFLVPIVIEDVKIPLAFRRLQSIELVDWDGNLESPQFKKIILDISTILGPPPNDVKKQNVVEKDKVTHVDEEKNKVDKQQVSQVEKQRQVKKQLEIERKKTTVVIDREIIETDSVKIDLSFYMLMCLATVSAYFFRLHIDAVSISFYVIALFSIAYIGDRYGKKIGLISGLVAFLPSLLMHFMGSNLGDFSSRGAFGVIRMSDGERQYTLGMAYIFFGSLGYVTGLLREKMLSWSRQYDFIAIDKQTSMNVFGLLVVSYLTAININLGDVRFDLAGLFFLIPMYIALRFGMDEVYRYLFLMLPLFVFKIQIGGGYDVVNYIGLTPNYQEIVLFLLCISMLGYLSFDQYLKKNSGKIWFFVLLVVAVIFLFDFAESKYLRYRTENIALPIIMLAGSILGPRRGFYLGFIWAAFILIDIRMGDVTWGLYGLHAIIAPVLGLLSGALLNRKNFLKYGAIIFISFQLYIPLATFLSTGTTAYRSDFYIGWIMGAVMGLISLAICIVIRKVIGDDDNVKEYVEYA